MSKYVIAQPPALEGSTEAKFAALYSYLFRMNQNLEIALANIDGANFTEKGLAEVRGGTGASAPATQAQTAREYETLRSLVIKTADTVRAEMDEIVAELSGEYVAVSDFGEYQESVSQEIRATATGIVQDFHFDQSIEALEEAQASFTNFQTSTNAYIKTGLLYYDGARPVTGVAVGETLTTTEVDGETVLTRQDLCATFTADRLSFWMGGVEVAYVSNQQLHIAQARVDEMDMGGWKVHRTDGFTVEWIGV